MKKFVITFIAATFITAASAPAFAQDSQSAPPPPTASVQPVSDPQPDQPASDAAQPGVARVSFILGDVSTQRGDNGNWSAATLNTPIAVGDRISTGPQSRAEVQLDYANLLRLSGGATAKIASLSRTQIQLQVGQGLVTYSLLKGGEAAVEIDTPNVAIRPAQGEGEYRILVKSDSETQVTVRRGSAQIVTPQGSTQVDGGQMIMIQGTDNPQYQTTQANAADDWDRFVSDRDRLITHADSWRHTNRYYTGTQDLDNYGHWTNVDDYGQVWVPNQGPNWAPYSTGRWVYEPYYGWTWVSYEPWGWAPYHYGRWFVYGGNWAWWPGPVGIYPGYYPIWAPAYVSFFGFGGGFGFGFGGFGSVGWLPLGPGDWCHPWWGHWGGRERFGAFGRAGFHEGFHDGFRPLGQGVRGHQFSNLHDAATNSRIRGGMSTMAGNRFGKDAVNGRGRGVNASQFRQAHMVAGKMGATPSRGSYSASNRAASPSTIRNGSTNSQRFFSASRANTANHTQSARSGVGSTARSNESARTQSSAGMNRSQSNSNAIRGGSGAGSQTSRPGFHSFTPPASANNRSSASGSNQRGLSAPRSNRGSSATAGNPGGFHTFNPPTRGSQPSASNRGGGMYGDSGRPQLNMRQPIVTPRGGSRNGGSPYGRGSNGGYRGAPSPSNRGGSGGGGSRGGSSPHTGGGSHGGGGSSHGGGGGGGSHKGGR
jgi:hypothetical protein